MGNIKKFIFAVAFSVATSSILCSPYNFTLQERENPSYEVIQPETAIEMNDHEIKPEVLPFVQDTFDKIYLGEFVLTAYCPCEKCCGEYGVNRPIDKNGDLIVYGTYGHRLEPGISIATDPNVIGFNQEVYINGCVYRAHDTGGNIKGNQIDIYMADHDEAVEFGVQYADVYLIQ